MNRVKQLCEKNKIESQSMIGQCVKKQSQFEERFGNEAIVVTHKLKSLESQKSVEVKLGKISGEVNEIKHKTRPTCVVNQEVKSPSTTNAELF